MAPLTRDELIQLDYYATGVTIHGHPMLALRDKLRAKGAKDTAEVEKMPAGRNVTIGGLVVIRQRPGTANGVLFLLLEDEHGFVNVVVRKDDVDANEDVVKTAQYILVRGYVSREGDALSVVGREYEEIETEERLAQQSRDFR